MQFTEHFTLEEFLTAGDAIPGDLVVGNLRKTAERLEVVRKTLKNNDIKIISGLRSCEVNKTLRGHKKSDHLSGLAVDFTCDAFGPTYDICKAIMFSQLNYDQLIHAQRPDGLRVVHLSFHHAFRNLRMTNDGRGYKLGIYKL